MKGNWERRVEQAQIRREENRAKKEQRKKGKGERVVNGESVWGKLSQIPDLLETAKVDAWLEIQPSVPVCSKHMRTAECRAKRCAYNHDCDSLCRYRNVGTMQEIEVESACFSVPLSEVLPRDRLMIRFVAIDGSLVFDWMIPVIWTSYLEETRQRLQLLALPAIVAEEATDEGGEFVETGEKDTEETQSCDGRCNYEVVERIGNLIEGERRRRGSSLAEDPSERFQGLLSLGQHLLHVIFSFLSVGSIGALMCSSKGLKKAVLKNPIVRNRRKEAFALCAHEESKRKKAEKKKKVVNGNARKSAGKKDEFARGGATGH